jgi:hypothetical protein
MKKLLFATLALIMSHATATAQSLLQDGTIVQGHLVNGLPPGTAPPTTTTCTLVAGSSDLFGSCAATSTAMAVVWGKPYLVAPKCLVVDQTTAADSTPTTGPTITGFAISTVVSGDKIWWLCFAQPGN